MTGGVSATIYRPSFSSTCTTPALLARIIHTHIHTHTHTHTRPLLIDTAHMYYNEKALGVQLNKHIVPKPTATATSTSDGGGGGAFNSRVDSDLTRGDLFMVTKIAHFNVDGVPPHTECSYVEDASLDAYSHASADIDRCTCCGAPARLLACLYEHLPGPAYRRVGSGGVGGERR